MPCGNMEPGLLYGELIVATDILPKKGTVPFTLSMSKCESLVQLGMADVFENVILSGAKNLSLWESDSFCLHLPITIDNVRIR